MNNSSIVDATPYADAEVDWALISLRLFICIAGIIGNLMVIFVIVILKEYKRSVTHWYVLQLAIADSVFLLTLPFKVIEDIENEWIFSAEICKAKETILFLNYYASILFLMIMSIDRYIAVCHGFSDRFQKFRTHRAANIITFVTWFIALLLCIPVMMYSNKAGIKPYCRCSYEFPKERDPHAICLKEGFKTPHEMEECINFQVMTSQDEELCRTFDDDKIYGGDYNYEEDYMGYDGLYEYSSNDTTGYYPITADSADQFIDGSCHYYDQGSAWSAFLIFNFIGMFIFPFIVMSFCYSMIISKLQVTKINSSRSDRQSSSVASSFVPLTSIRDKRGPFSQQSSRSRNKSFASVRANKERNRVTVMCAVLVGLFVMCWLPFHAIHIAKIRGLNASAKWCTLLPIVASSIAYMNSALNPYVYNFLGTRFGIRLRKASTTIRRSIKRRASSVTSTSGGVVYRKKKSRDGSSQGTSITKLCGGLKSKGELSSTNDDVFLQSERFGKSEMATSTQNDDRLMIKQTTTLQEI